MIRHLLHFRVVLTAAFGAPLVALSSCGDTTQACDDLLARTEQAIRLENPSEGLVGQVGPSTPVLIEMYSNHGSNHLLARCTGNFVAAGVVLTAKHCLGDIPEVLVVVRTPATARTDGCDDESPRVAQIEQHPSLDLVLLYLDSRHSRPPVPLFSSAPKSGSTFWMSGHGVTEDWYTNELRTIKAILLDTTQSTVTVQGIGGGACVGDSGGPLYTLASDGSVALLGILSRGSATCLGADEYVRLVAARDWLDEQVGSITWQE